MLDHMSIYLCWAISPSDHIGHLSFFQCRTICPSIYAEPSVHLPMLGIHTGLGEGSHHLQFLLMTVKICFSF